MINVKQNQLYPYTPEYIQDFPPPPPPAEFVSKHRKDFDAVLDELEESINELVLTIKHLRSRCDGND